MSSWRWRSRSFNRTNGYWLMLKIEITSMRTPCLRLRMRCLDNDQRRLHIAMLRNGSQMQMIYNTWTQSSNNKLCSHSQMWRYLNKFLPRKCSKIHHQLLDLQGLHQAYMRNNQYQWHICKHLKVWYRWFHCPTIKFWCSHRAVLQHLQSATKELMQRSAHMDNNC